MGKGTAIQWADDTVNSSSGCDGCELWTIADKSIVPPRGAGPCYAGNLHEQRLAKSLPDLYDENFFNVRTIPGRMARAASAKDLWDVKRPEKPWLDGYPRLIFVGDLGDLFSRDVPFEYIADEVFGAALSPRGRLHTYLLLTKQPGRAASFGRWLREERGIAWPRNVWTGTSITSNASLRRIDALMHVPGHHYLSVEPLVENVNLEPYLPSAGPCSRLMATSWDGFPWPAWVPAGVQGEIEGFWADCAGTGRSPREWIEDSISQGAPPFGSVQTLQAHSYPQGERTGRFVHAWNNIGRLVHHDGSVSHVTFPVTFPGRLGTVDKIGWVICGGESSQRGYQARPFNLHWARKIQSLCFNAGVPFFMKQCGSRPFDDRTGGSRYDDHTYHKFRDHHGGDWSEWPADLRVRQMPERWRMRASA